jgi:hypothetical protein
LADPIEGLPYGRTKAMVMRRADGSLFIKSYAHGHIFYELKRDYRAIEVALKKSPPDDAASLFVRLVLDAELDCIELERLRDLTSKLSGTNRRSLDTLLKRAREERLAARAKEERERRIAERLDPRPQIPAPPRDAPWLPQMEVLNQVLGKVRQSEPPMRDIDGVLAAVYVRRVGNMHAFTSLGANQEEPEALRLPPAEQPLLTRLSKGQAAELIERHVDYTDKEGRSVHLGSGFVDHFHVRGDDDALPLVVAVADPSEEGRLYANGGREKHAVPVRRVARRYRNYLRGQMCHDCRCAHHHRAIAVARPADILGDRRTQGRRQDDNAHHAVDGRDWCMSTRCRVVA